MSKLVSGRPDVAKEVLDSQMLSQRDINFIQSKKFAEFLNYRAVEIWYDAKQVVTEQLCQFTTSTAKADCNIALL